MEKLCKRCNLIKPISEFYKVKGRTRSPCKTCHKKDVKKWGKVNKQKRNQTTLKWRKNKGRIRYNEYMKNYNKTRRLEDINFKLSQNLRIRLRDGLRFDLKSGKNFGGEAFRTKDKV